MEDEFNDLPDELRDAFARMLQRASGEAGREMAVTIVKREGELWPLVKQALEEVRGDGTGSPGFNRLWEEIRREVRITIRGVLYRKDDEDVDEVEQLTALEVLRMLKKYSVEKGTFLVWVRGIARNQAKWRRADRQYQQIATPPRRPGQELMLPPSACFREILSKVQEKEAHQVAVFLLHKYLEWQPASIGDELGAKTIYELTLLVVREIQEKVHGLENVREIFARLLQKAKAAGDAKLMELYGAEAANDALSHWSSAVVRWMRGQVIGGGKRFLRAVCELRAGAHERLTFILWAFLRRSLDSLCRRAAESLVALLLEFRRDFPRLSDLTFAEVVYATEPLEKDIPAGKTLAECSRGDLAGDLPIWRDNIQKMVSAKCKGWDVVAYAYLCGALPGIVGPAKRGVA
jgi:DNA-directed RNA polymerase specialized sigma24 family protein